MVTAPPIPLAPGTLAVFKTMSCLPVKVNGNTPPTFIVQTQDDGVGPENSVNYYIALTRAKVPAELHLYAAGGHGYGLRKNEKQVTNWPHHVEDWMRGMALLKN